MKETTQGNPDIFFFQGFESHFEQVKSQIGNLYSQVEAWQGTGRYQYRDGRVMDILDAIIDAGGLTPQRDGDHQVISTTGCRPYAGVYADVHQYNGEKLGFQYHTSRYWAKRIRNRVVKHGWKSVASFHPLKARQVAIEWAKKRVAHPPLNPLKLLSLYDIKSDIPGNYSILIGIRNITTKSLPVSEFIALHEKQYGESIPLENLHLEVPQRYLEKTQNYLSIRGINIPVIARELGERYSAGFSEEALITSNPFLK